MIISSYYEEDETCQLLGPLSIGIQIILGAWIVASLLVKRNYEHPKRKLIVWTYDVSKQLIGSLLVHFLNLFISVVNDHKPSISLVLDPRHNIDTDGDDDQCGYYFLNLLLDTTIGIPIFWVAFTSIEKLCTDYNFKNIESGNYFVLDKTNPSTFNKKPSFTAFLKQLSIFTGGLIVMKSIIFFILYYFESFAYWFADILLGWSDKWPNFQIFLVVFISPIALNLFQYYCVDNIIKLHSNHITKLNAENFESSVEDYNNSITESLNANNQIIDPQHPFSYTDNDIDSSKYGSI